MSQRSLFPRTGLPAGLRADFDVFWRSYPARRPNPRALAEAEFAKAVRAGAAPADLTAAAAAYADQVKKLGIAEAFVVHAATFLRQHRFLDYLPADGAAPAASVSQPDPDHPLWQATRGAISVAEFQRWIAPLVVVSHTEGDAALLQAPSRFHRDWVRAHYRVQLRLALRVRILDVEIAEDIRP